MLIHDESEAHLRLQPSSILCQRDQDRLVMPLWIGSAPDSKYPSFSRHYKRTARMGLGGPIPPVDEFNMDILF